MSCALRQKAEYELQEVKTSGAKWHSCPILWHFTLKHCHILWHFTLKNCHILWHFTLTYCHVLWHFILTHCRILNCQIVAHCGIYIDILVTTLGTVNTLLFFGSVFLRSIGHWLIKEKTWTITFKSFFLLFFVCFFSSVFLRSIGQWLI